jgi:hypothetical protein
LLRIAQSFRKGPGVLAQAAQELSEIHAKLRFVRAESDRDDSDDDRRRATPAASGRAAPGGSATAGWRRDDYRWRRGLGDDDRRLSDNHRRLRDDDRRRGWSGSHHDGRGWRRKHNRRRRRTRGRAEGGAKARPGHRIRRVRGIGRHWRKGRIGGICWGARHRICLPWVSSRSTTFRLASSQFLDQSAERHSLCLWRRCCRLSRGAGLGLSTRLSASTSASSDR